MTFFVSSGDNQKERTVYELIQTITLKPKESFWQLVYFQLGCASCDGFEANALAVHSSENSSYVPNFSIG